jgi:hypothetical protein
LGQNWRAAFNNNEEMGRDATARVFFTGVIELNVVQLIYELYTNYIRTIHEFTVYFTPLVELSTIVQLLH